MMLDFKDGFRFELGRLAARFVSGLIFMVGLALVIGAVGWLLQ